MNTPSRREFLTYAAAATLASASSASARTINKLAVDLIGPMALQWNSGPPARLFAWMPSLTAGATTTHEAGIITPITSFPLAKGDYEMNGPDPSGVKPTPFGGHTIKRFLYTDANAKVPSQYHVKMSLPWPFAIVPIYLESAIIWRATDPEPSQPFTYYATGVRLLYKKANTPVLNPTKPIKFDSADDEAQKDMTISYTPYNIYDSTYSKPDPNNDPHNIFQTLNNSLGLDLKIKFEDERATQHMPCRSPMILLP